MVKLGAKNYEYIKKAVINNIFFKYSKVLYIGKI